MSVPDGSFVVARLDDRAFPGRFLPPVRPLANSCGLVWRFVGRLSSSWWWFGPFADDGAVGVLELPVVWRVSHDQAVAVLVEPVVVVRAQQRQVVEVGGSAVLAVV